MKIGIISSSTESLGLFAWLNRYDHHYLIYLDTRNAPYGDKSFAHSLQAVIQGITTLTAQGTQKIILPPLYELALLLDPQVPKNTKNLILPLFSDYLLQQVFPHSLVGKLGLFGDPEELHIAQQLIRQLADHFTPTPAQLATKPFRFPFHFWSKETSILKHLLSKLSWKAFLTNTLIKHQLRIFKDAAVDTVIPLNYTSFNAQKTITKFFNFKKIRFHSATHLETIFQHHTQHHTSPYQITVLHNDSAFPLTSQKRLLRLLQKGKQHPIERISLA
ncbi:MAG: hypothetical protein Q4B28_01485 [bacterium]|nr:hypothetical protein [bacterium]